MRFINISIFILFTIFNLNGQHRIFVLDAQSGEPITGCSSRTIDLKWYTTCDKDGSVVLPKINDTTQIVFSYPGYITDTIIYNKLKTKSIVKLEPEILPIVEITAFNDRNATELLQSRTISLEQIKSIPQLGGEADIFKSLSLLPGISTGGEGTSGLYIRGGTPDQNLILIDDAPTYNLNHLFGFISAINPDAVKNVNLYHGPIPARYGGRLSSVIDLTVKEGNKNKWNKDASVGLISSHVNLNGPISDKVVLNFNARANYLGLLLLPTYPAYKRGTSKNYFNFSMYDINAKVTYNISEKNKLTFSFYDGKDHILANSKQSSDISKAKNNWGNRIFSMKYNHFWKSGVSKIVVTYNQYIYDFNFNTFDSNESRIDGFSNQSNVKDFNIKNLNSFTLFDKQNIDFGMELNNMSILPSKFQLFDGSDKKYGDSTYFLSSINPFVDLKFKFRKWHFDLGYRVGIFGRDQKIYFQPRIAAGYDYSDKSSFLFSVTNTVQQLHSLTNYNSLSENELWIPATSKLKPETAVLSTLSSYHKKLFWGLDIRTGLFFKRMSNQVDYIRNGDRFSIFNLVTSGDFEDKLASNGIGTTTGLELQLEKSAGNIKGWISYTYSRNLRRFSQINNGQEYNHLYDRPHSLSIVASSSLSKKWTINSTFVFESGRPVTLPTARVLGQDGDYFYIFEGRNNKRMPVYHRLDIGLTKSIETEKGIRSWTFGLYNAYARRNPYALEVANRLNFKEGNSKIVIVQKSIFQFIPSVNFTYKWK